MTQERKIVDVYAREIVRSDERRRHLLAIERDRRILQASPLKPDLLLSGYEMLREEMEGI